MKQSLLLGLAAAALLAGCNDGKLPGWSSTTGGIAPAVNVDASVSTGSRAVTSAKAIEAADLSLRLTAADGSLERTWARVADFDTDEAFSVGDYTMQAFYGTEGAEGFDAPYYSGTTALTVRENQVTAVNITASLANSMVSITYTDALKSYLADWDAVVSSSAGKSEIAFAKDETRPAYITPGSVTLRLNITKPNGTSATLQAATFTAQPRHHYNVTVDLNDGEVGEGVLTITYVDDTEEKVIDINLSEDIISAPAPEVTTIGFTSGDVLSHVESAAADAQLALNIVARGGIASVKMTTESASLRQQGWPAEVDLIGTDAATQATLRTLGLKPLGLWKNPDKMAVVDLTDVLSHLTVTAAGASDSKFTFTVTDRYTKTSEPVELTVNVVKLNLAITGHEPLLYEADNVDLHVAYNGSNLADNVTFQTKNARGTWDAVEVNSVTADGDDAYTVNLKLAAPASGDKLTFRAVAKTGLTSEVIDVPVGGFALASTDNNTFATYAIVKVTGDVADALSFEYSTDNGSTYAPATAARAASRARSAEQAFKVSGLPAGSTVMLRAKSADFTSNPITVTTEAATQLPNSNLETWEITASESNWQRWAVEGWATYNNMTTMTSGTRHNTAYVSRSGAAQSTDAHSGSYAAELRTIGWGAGNSAYGTIGSDNPKYINKGLLYLGTSPTDYSALDQQVVKGVDFASRPSALKFWYKYAKKNSADYGGATIWVKDAAGNIIASGTADNLSEGSYTQVTVPLTYALDVQKAATIYVEFASSNHPDWDTRSKDWFSVPPLMNLSDGKFQGSQLFIDDIELIY